MSIRIGRFSAKLLASIAALSLVGSGVAVADENPNLLGDDGNTVESIESSAIPTGDATAVADSEATAVPDEQNSDVSEVEDVFDDEGGAANVVTDPKLRKCINSELNRGSGNDAGLTTADLSQLTGELSCSGDVSTLEGVQYLRNVEVLDFYDLYTDDVSALSKFSKNNKVTKLYYPMSSITTVPDLSALQQLTYFNFTNVNYFSLFARQKSIRGELLDNINGLANLKNLKTLILDTNSIGDISALASLPNLEVLNLKNNQISDISPLSSCSKLREVDLYNNLVSNIKPLGQLKNLQELDLSRNRIGTIPTSFEKMPIQSLRIGYNKIKDFTNLPNASYLYIGDQVSKEAYRSGLGGAYWRNPAYFAAEAVYNTNKDVTTIDMRSFRDSYGKYATKVCKAEKYEESNNSGYNFRISDCGELLSNGQYAQFTGEYVTGQYFGYYFSSSGIVGIVKIKRVKKFSGVKVSDITLSGAAKVTAGKSITLKASVSPSNAANKAVTWKSSNTAVATVNASGKVTGKKAGTVTITATAKDGSKKKASKKITVTKPVKVSSVKVAASGSAKVTAGSSVTVKASVSPSNATNKAVSWKSSNTAVATVNANGKVTGKKAGTVTITATAKDGSGKKASIKVTVVKAEAVQVMYRLYNRVSHEHLYTADVHERDVLRRGDWNYEGVAWVAPKKSKTPVYRLYNPILGDHHYTTDTNEVKVLTSKHGWRNEGVKWYSDDKKRVKVYRQFNPKLRVGSHNYTADLNEYKINNARNGWKGEGIAWYAVRLK